ncbi:hypothetical protein [Nocardia sp. NPDC057227]|uniref:hypothetical protein n=1 Tax=Nocardia sp. NPDC057227 TaxID=3346056 RepID=UPI00362594BB
MQFLGKNAGSHQSPTLYLSDRHTYVVQSSRVPDQPDLIEIPHPLLGFLERGTCLGAQLHDTGHGTFTLTGTPVTDTEALAQMLIPAHETSIEVPIGKEIRRDVLSDR